jgi:WD40 repeat protein
MFFRGNDSVSTDLLEETGRFTEEFEVNSIALSPDGARVATGGFSHAGVGIWDVASKKRLVHHALNGAGVPHGSVVWGGENSVAALEASGSRAKVWGGDAYSLMHQLDLKDYGVGQSIAFNQDGTRLMAACG